MYIFLLISQYLQLHNVHILSLKNISLEDRCGRNVCNLSTHAEGWQHQDQPGLNRKPHQKKKKKERKKKKRKEGRKEGRQEGRKGKREKRIGEEKRTRKDKTR
jgi:hypothetical protein